MSRATNKFTEDVHVVYSGSLQIPISIGSIAIPLAELANACDNSAVLSSSSPPPPPPAPSPLPSSSSSLPSRDARVGRKRNRSSTGGAAANSAAATTASGTAASLTSSITGNRYTHKRYCYIRDGSDLSEDCFYRWLLHHTDGRQSSASNNGDHKEEGTEASGSPHKRPRTAAGKSGTGDLVGEEWASNNNGGDGMANDEHTVVQRGARHVIVIDGEDRSPNLASSSTCDAALVPKSPSLLYSFIDRVEFTVPSSFSKPRRVVRSPPFLIEDDTWAEHLVEIKIFFLPSLAIPPTTLMHQVLLQARVVGLPVGLLSANQGLPKPTPMVLINTLRVGAKKEPAGMAAEADSEERWREFCAAITVSERQDSLRILHPSFTVVEHFRRVLAKQEVPLIAGLRAHFLAHVFGEPVSTSSWGKQEKNLSHAGSAKAAPVTEKRVISTVHEPTLCFDSLPALYRATSGAASLTNLLSASTQNSGYLFPAEACLYDHVQRRQERCIAALSSVLCDLMAEQQGMCSSIDRMLEAMRVEATEMQERLAMLHSACLKKLKE